MILIEYAPAMLIALVVVLLGIPPLASLGEKFGWVYENKKAIRHVMMPPVPYVGGVGVLVGLIAAALVTSWPPEALGLAIGMVVVFVLGTIEDRLPMRRRFWLSGMAAAAAVAVIGGQHLITSTGQLLGPFEIPLNIFAIPFTMAVVGIIAISFRALDRADGLCDGQALITALGMVVVAVLLSTTGSEAWPMPGFMIVALSLVGALLGLALYTMRRPGRRLAAVYLGSAGAMMLGLIIGWLGLQIHAGFGERGIGLGGLMWLVAVPLTDLCFYGVRRLMAGRDWSAKDKYRIYHWLRDQQFEVGQSVAITHGASIAAAAVGILGWAFGLPDFFLFWGFWVAFAVYSMVALAYWTNEGSRQLHADHWRTHVPPKEDAEAIDVEAHTVLGGFEDSDIAHNPYRNGTLPKPRPKP